MEAQDRRENELYKKEKEFFRFIQQENNKQSRNRKMMRRIIEIMTDDYKISRENKTLYQLEKEIIEYEKNNPLYLGNYEEKIKALIRD